MSTLGEFPDLVGQNYGDLTEVGPETCGSLLPA